MDRYTELEKQAQKFLDETDTMQFSTVELLTMFYEHQKQLTLTDVGFTLPRPLEAWNEAQKLDVADYIDWHLGKEKSGN